MTASVEGPRSPSFAARRRYYAFRLKRQISRLWLLPLRSAMLRSASRQDVVECYRAILGREPENRQAVEGHLSNRPLLREIITDFSQSGELRAKLLRSNVALDRAREPNYLAKSFHGIQSVHAYFGHYGYLVEQLTAEALDALISDHALLHIHHTPRTEYRVVATATHDRHEEGELQLQLYREDALIYVMGVTIVPGDVVGQAHPRALLISRMQGVPGAFWEIRQATKDFGEIQPKAVLLAALQGLAEAAGIAAIAGVTATNQIAYRQKNAETLLKSYDEFFAATGAEKRNEHFYVFEPGRERKAPSSADRAHVKRAERKRRLKAEITAAAAAEARTWFRSLAGSEIVGLPGERGLDALQAVDSLPC